jgi:hypothetical protein
MLKAELKARIEFLSQSLAQSQANHNAIVGRLEEAKFLLDTLEKKEKEVAEVVDHT